MKKTKRKIYKIGLFGYSGSGKSCILTALGMPRRPNSDGLSATWLSMGELDNSEHSNGLKAGKQWLEAAIKQITKGELPPPTGHDVKFIFEYEFGTSEGRTFRIDIFDYSGELVQTDLDENQIAQDLRKKFLELDGILILAESPNLIRYSPDNQKIYDKICRLSRVFAQVRDQKQEGTHFDVPVAMLVNKWDRWSPDFKVIPHDSGTSSASPNEKINLTKSSKTVQNKFNFLVQKKLLDQFMEDQNNSVYKSLYDTLYNVTLPDNFEVFPVSAFGSSQLVSVDKDSHQVECPQVRVPLQSFGLEEPFVWLAQRCDEVDFTRLQETAKKNVFLCMGKSQELLLRFPQESPYAQEIIQIGKNCQKKLMIGSVVGFFSLALVGLIAESVLDHFQLRQHLSNIENPKTEQTALNSAEIWLQNYANSPRFRHSLSRLTFNREDAKKMLQKLRHDREEQLWQTVIASTELNAQISLAEDYLQRYSNGSYRIPADELILKIKTKRQTTDYHSALSRIKQEATIFTNEAEKLNQLLAELKDLSGKFPLVSDAELRAEFERLRNQISDRYTRLLSQKNLQEFFASYNNAMNEGNLTLAAELLNQRKDDTSPELVALIKDFPQYSLSILKKQINADLANDRFGKAYQILLNYKNIPVYLRQENDAQLQKLELEIDKRQDQHIYEHARHNPILANLDRYLREAPLKAMQREVNAYREYLSKINPNAVISNLQLQITRIEWTAAAEKEKNNLLRVRMNEVEVRKNVSSREVVTSLPIQIFKATSDEKLNIVVEVTYKSWWSNQNNGNATFTSTPAKLARSIKKVDLRDAEGKHTATVHFGLTGYPQAPVLPVWKYQ